MEYMSDVTSRVSTFIKDRGLQITTIAKKTGVSLDVLYNSLSGKRKLRADEYLAICDFLGKDPNDFYKKTA